MSDGKGQKRIITFLRKFAKEDLKKINVKNKEEVRTLVKRITGRIPERHWSDFAEVMVAVGLHRQAMGILKKIIKREPKNKRALNNMGVVHSKTGELEKAIEFYDRALKIDRTYEVVWFNKGKALFKIDDIHTARKCFRKAVALNRRNISAWNNLGLVLKYEGDMEGAIKCYKEAIDINKEYPFAWNNLGYAYLDSGRPQKAQKCFKIALRLKPDYEVAKRGRMRALEKS
ncbi:MAG: tetratricopeptide repeat protein [Thermoplasmata archaeon]|nr:tetratricopeptide repeat protein [Thermoplasmata archaeon]